MQNSDEVEFFKWFLYIIYSFELPNKVKNKIFNWIKDHFIQILDNNSLIASVYCPLLATTVLVLVTCSPLSFV
jgi:hypothetical protein